MIGSMLKAGLSSRKIPSLGLYKETAFAWVFIRDPGFAKVRKTFTLLFSGKNEA
jgi:hypothetical protein